MVPAGRRRGLGWLYFVHLWVGIVVAFQLLLWTASGLFMTSNAIETVRGEHLRRRVVADLRSAGALVPIAGILSGPTEAVELIMVAGRPAYRLRTGKAVSLVDARSGAPWTLKAADALAIADAAVAVSGNPVATPVSDPPPRELRKPGGAWRVAWPDGTNVYVGQGGEIMAVRTALWRWYDLAWGWHILDPGGREDSHHLLLIASAAMALLSVTTGIILVFVHFRRRA